jgi:hypothetical protein
MGNNLLDGGGLSALEGYGSLAICTLTCFRPPPRPIKSRMRIVIESTSPTSLGRVYFANISRDRNFGPIRITSDMYLFLEDDLFAPICLHLQPP